tara:strand:+ start:293 stop:742 length:450 start_codon:yes stop_codon:yes gene_type:complete
MSDKPSDLMSCRSCGKIWREHRGLELTCAENIRLKDIIRRAEIAFCEDGTDKDAAYKMYAILGETYNKDKPMDTNGKYLFRNKDNWRLCDHNDFNYKELLGADIAGAFGDGGFGVKVIKNRYGNIGIAEDKHWTDVRDRLIRGHDTFLR